MFEMFNFTASSQKTALLSERDSISYEELERRAKGFQNWFHLNKVPCAPLLLFPTTSSIFLYLGAFHSVQRIVPIGPGFLTHEPSRLRALIKRHGLFVSREDFGENASFIKRLAIENIRVVEEEVSSHPLEPLKPSTPEIVFHTSSTSGNGVRAVLTTAKYLPLFFHWCQQSFNLQSNDRFVLVAPFHFDMNLFDFFLPLHLGATILLPKTGTFLYPKTFLQFFHQYSPTVVHSVPSVWTSLVRSTIESEPETFESVSKVLFAGDILPEFFYETLKQVFSKARFFSVYGQTEANSYLKGEIHSQEDLRYPPLLGDSETYSKIGLESDGELRVAGPNVARGYLSEDYSTLLAFDGNYRTGDLVTEEGGRLRFLGRKEGNASAQDLRLRCKANSVKGVVQSVVAHPKGKKPILVYEPVDEMNLKEIQTEFEGAVPKRHLPLTYNGKIDTAGLL